MKPHAGIQRRFALAWLILVVATVFSFEVLQRSASHALATRIVLGIAAVKIAIIGLEFMELRMALSWLRYLFLGWIVLISALLVALLTF
jgi:hypothetical protein